MAGGLFVGKVESLNKAAKQKFGGYDALYL